jgi:hypothetical protein
VCAVHVKRASLPVSGGICRVVDVAGHSNRDFIPCGQATATNSTLTRNNSNSIPALTDLALPSHRRCLFGRVGGIEGCC